MATLSLQILSGIDLAGIFKRLLLPHPDSDTSAGIVGVTFSGSRKPLLLSPSLHSTYLCQPGISCLTHWGSLATGVPESILAFRLLLNSTARDIVIKLVPSLLASALDLPRTAHFSQHRKQSPFNGLPGSTQFPHQIPP